jgi:DNA-binding beta-propeller fold protein YncE
MTTPPESGDAPIVDQEVQQIVSDQIKDERKRRVLLVLLLLLLLLICCIGVLFINYLRKPKPLPELLPPAVAENVVYPPTYLFYISGVDKPVAVAASPDGQRLYVAEGGGERLVKMFDRNGNLIQRMAPPGTNQSNRKPNYIAVDVQGRVFVSDNYNHVIDIFDADGNFIDAIISQDMTLSKFVTEKVGQALQKGTLYYYNAIDQNVYWQLPDGQLTAHPFLPKEGWTPLGLRFDNKGDLLVTNMASSDKIVTIIPSEALDAPLTEFNPQITGFGQEGTGDGQLSFPNSAVTDSRGNFYVSDSNNGRISYWTSDMQYKTFFGFGTAESGLNLPRGAWMDSRNYLHVADAVGQVVRVYDVSGAEPAFLYNFGDFGNTDGLFNFPTDVCIDSSRRVYVADQENNRISVWSY